MQKTKVLWIYNAITYDFADAYNVKRSIAAGWSVGLKDAMLKNGDLEIDACFPIVNREKLRNGNHNGTQFYSLYVGDGDIAYEEIELEMEKILKESSPDVVHIWGTEYSFSLPVFKACRKAASLPTIIHLQGNIDAMMHSLEKGIPQDVIDDRIGNNPSIRDEIDRWELCSENERKILEEAEYVCGRTLWDKLYVYQYNNRIKYYHCDELLRPEFYQEKRRWSCHKCNRHTIFLSQGFYPLKGLHFLIRAIPYVKAIYDDIHIVIGGYDSFVKQDDDNGISGYGKYILDLAKEYQVVNTLEFCGVLDANGMIEQMLSANIMVSTSAVENSSNSICEAMYLGLPIVASFVGGTSSMLTDEVTGLMYCYDDYRMLAGQICRAFSDDELLDNLSNESQHIAKQRHDPIKVSTNMMEIYREIIH